MAEESVVESGVEEVLITIYTPMGPESYLNPTNIEVETITRLVAFNWSCKHGHARRITFVGMAFVLNKGEPHKEEEQERLQQLKTANGRSEGRVN